jgi:RNA-directed DNA polymerase
MKSSIGKRSQTRVKKIIDSIDEYAIKIQRLLANKTYKPSPYIIKIIQDGASKKTRTIHKPKYYPDQIIHWALMLQLQPIIMRGMYKYSCGSIPGRGTSYGQKILRKWLDADYKGTKYCLKMDISKFYPSIDNKVMKRMFRRKIKDKDCLWLIDTIIDSNQGMPIGNYTSQWFANFFLQGLDHYIKEKLGVKYYIRYVDDLVILGGNKKKLHRARRDVSDYLNSINLSLKNDWQVFRVNDRAIDFLGFRFFRNKTILRKRNALRIRRRMLKIQKKDTLTSRDACAVISYWGWIKRSDSYNFYHKYVRPIVSVGYAKKVVSCNAKANNLR